MSALSLSLFENFNNAHVATARWQLEKLHRETGIETISQIAARLIPNLAVKLPYLYGGTVLALSA